MQLYYIPSTRAFRPRWLLEEMKLPYDLITVTLEQTRTEDYRRLHPHGKVPVLVDRDVTLFESAAICSYLADRYPDRGLAPGPTSQARGYYYQWLFYGSLTLEAPVEQFMFQVLPDLPEKLLPKTAQTHGSKEEALAWFQRVCEPLNQHLAHHSYLVDDRFSSADVVIAGVLYWALELGMMGESSPVKTYLERLMERPAFQVCQDI